MRHHCFGTQARIFACLLLVGLVAAVLSGLPTSATNSPRAVRNRRADERPDFTTNNYRQTNLVSDIPGFAQIQDALLKNPWGVAFSPTGSFWVANTGSRRVTLYDGDVGGSPFVKNSLVVAMEPDSDVTGVAFNGSGNHVIQGAGGSIGPARFVFDTFNTFENAGGGILGWSSGTTAFQRLSTPDGAYTGITMADFGGGTGELIYGADFREARIYQSDPDWSSGGGGPLFFVDHQTMPAGFACFNIKNFGGNLYITYAKQDTARRHDVPGPGNGYISMFDSHGNFIRRLVSNGPLNSPWGMAIAPSGFGAFPGALLIGNFGDGKINAFNFATGAFLGTLNDESGNPIVIPGLRALTFGNGVGGGDTDTLYFTAGYDGERHGLFGSLRSSTPALTTVQFGGPSVSVAESFSFVDINVTRSGDLSAPSTVNYATYDGSPPVSPATSPVPATQGKDYLLAAGTLTFDIGQVSKTFRILIPDDGFEESAETINLVLSNPTGAALGSQRTAILTITANDTPAPTTNPIDDAQFFVRQHYSDFLNREPDAGGLSFWTGTITSCGADVQCTQVKRINASGAFFLSIEFQKAGLTAYLAPKAALGAIPLYGRFEIDTQALQKNLVFGTPGFDSQLETNKMAFFADFVTRSEFLGKYPATQSGPAFVDALIATIQTSSSVDLTPRRPDLVNEYLLGATQAQSRGRVVRKAIDYSEFVNAEFNSAFVTMQYFGYLRRDVDTAGFNFWLAKLNQFNGNFVNAEMVKAFITSTEYRQRFGN